MGKRIKPPKRSLKHVGEERETSFEVVLRFEFVAPLTAEEVATSLTAACNAMVDTAFLDDRVAAAGIRLPEGNLMKERPVRPTLKVVQG